LKGQIKGKLIMACCAAAAVAMASEAAAKPRHHHHVAASQATIETNRSPGDKVDQRYVNIGPVAAAAAPTRKQARRVINRAAAPKLQQAALQAQASASAAAPVFGASDIVADARRYIGTNPTGRRSLWCGAFMDMVLKQTGHKGGGNLARAYAKYGRRVWGPQVGAIAVMGRRGGGHVGVVSGVDASGNPIIISGNHNRTVAESVYPRGRIIAYVMPE
jgi:uncharacterized protein (TIGR02594 family)